MKLSKPSNFLILGILTLIGAIFLLFVLSSKQEQTNSSLSMNIPLNANLGGDFTLLSTTGQILDSKTLRGNVVLITFGYAECIEVCPLGLLKLHEVIKSLSSDAKDLRVIFVSFDSKNKLEKLEKYINKYDKSIIGLTGSEQEIIDLTNRYGVVYPKEQKISGKQGYEHNGFIYLIDKNGNIRSIYQNNTSIKDIVKDVRILLKHK